ncbi:MAG: hypothetical protein MUF00_16960 [Gemmatimonadaceae bacterium]|nr:hypothetical protein [Gemmatimonadaceae bacterium]
MSRTTSWVDWAGGSAERLRTGLLQAGWDAGGIEHVLHEYAAGQLGSSETTTLRERIEGLLRIRETRVERVDTVTVNVPLFAFSAPAVKGARVVYSETRTTSRGRSWLLNFSPVGTSHAATLDVEQVASYTAGAGSCKLVLVPVAVRVEQLTILRHGQVVGYGVRAGALPPEESQDSDLRRRAVQSIRASDLPSPEASPFDVLAVDVTQDRSRDIHTASRAWTIDVGREVSAAIPGIPFSANVKLRQLNKLTLAFDLPAGHAYHAELYPTHLAWTRPTEPTATRRRRAA